MPAVPELRLVLMRKSPEKFLAVMHQSIKLIATSYPREQ